MEFKSNHVKILNEWIKQVVEKVSATSQQGITDSTTSLRDGVISYIMKHTELLGQTHAVFQSGHDHTNICSVY
jgi:hypothetical protein